MEHKKKGLHQNHSRIGTGEVCEAARATFPSFNDIQASSLPKGFLLSRMLSPFPHFCLTPLEVFCRWLLQLSILDKVYPHRKK